MITKIVILAKKELRGYFDSPTAYVLLIVWTAMVSYFFFRTAFLVNEASTRPLFDLIPWFLLFFIPAVTMRLLSAEKKDGTLEVLLSHPVDELAVIGGKLLATVLFAGIALALTLPLPLGLSLGGRLDIGMIIGQYAGALFMVLGLASVGLFASSLTRNQTVAFIISLALTFFFIVSGLDFIIMAVPFPLTGLLREISVLTHFDSLARGVIALADVVYFLALTAIFTSLSYFGLRREREARSSERFSRLRQGTALIVAISALSALIAVQVGGRVDLTAGRLYSLSGATVQLLRNLPDPVTIKLFASRQLPPEAEVALRDTKDVIADYQAASGGKVKSALIAPEGNQQAQREAQEAGVQLVQFNVVRQDEYQVKQGYLGLLVEYQNKREAVPFIKSTDDLEYQLSGLIKKISQEKKKKIVFLGGHASGHGSSAKPGEEDDLTYNIWRSGLSEQYEVVDAVINEKNQKLPRDTAVVVIAAPGTGASQGELEELKAFVERGGSILALLEPLEVNPKLGYVVPAENNFIKFIGDYGFKVEPKLLFDMKANQPVTAGDEGQQYLLPYPFWMQVGPASNHIIVRNINAVTIPWGMPLKVTKKGKGIEPLLMTTQYAGAQTKDFRINPDPDMTVKPNELATFVVAGARSLSGGGRLAVVGDADFLKDRYLGVQNTANEAFGMNAVDWLAQDANLAGIRAKSGRAQPLIFPSETVREAIRYLNLIGVPVLIAIYGAIRLNRRRARTKKVLVL